MAARTPSLTAIDRDYFTSIAQATWRYFDVFVNADHHHLPPDNVQVDPDTRVAHRTSPTNIGMGLLATLAAHDFGFIDTDTLIVRLDATLTTVEGLERFEGHLLNWYDTPTLAPLTPAYRLNGRQREPCRRAPDARVGLRLLMDHAEPAQARRLEELSARATVFVDGMNFRFLYDRQRHLFSIGYRLADGEGPGRLDPSFYDLLASEARLASFVAIAKGEVPEMHWFHLGRLVTSVHGAPVLLSWSATLFEYLMPLLVMRSYPNTLLDESCRMVVRRQIEYAASRGMPWGISESAYTSVDRHGNYQYKAFGVPGLGLKRGLGDEVVVAPYATALAADDRSASQRRRTSGGLRTRGRSGDYGFFDAIDYTQRERYGDDARDGGVVVRTYFAHHEGMTLVALANALFGDRMVERFHADPRVQATELLLQERVPRSARRPSRGRSTRCGWSRRCRRAGPPLPDPAHGVSACAVSIERQVRRRASPTPAVARALCRGLAVTRSRHDATCDHGQPVLVSARRAQRRRVVADLSPDAPGGR